MYGFSVLGLGGRENRNCLWLAQYTEQIKASQSILNGAKPVYNINDLCQLPASAFPMSSPSCTDSALACPGLEIKASGKGTWNYCVGLQLETVQTPPTSRLARQGVEHLLLIVFGFPQNRKLPNSPGSMTAGRYHVPSTVLHASKMMSCSCLSPIWQLRTNSIWP